MTTAPRDPAIDNSLKEMALDVIQTEVDAVSLLAKRIDETFLQACHLILGCQGKVILLGMGKSGHIANKIAATMASTGTPSFYVHPAEAGHGDMGMIDEGDVVIAISYSGETREVVDIAPSIKRRHVPIIAMVGNVNSTLARAADVVLDVSVDKEACPLGLAPTASTTACLAMGDALAVALLSARGFTQEDFAKSHPSGTLGKRLLWHVSDVMRTGKQLPLSKRGSKLNVAVEEMNKVTCNPPGQVWGLTMVVDDEGHLCGIYTDGDLRRTINEHHQIDQLLIDDVMSTQPKTIAGTELAYEAAIFMTEHKITALVVVDEADHPVGLIHIHDLMQKGII